MTGPLRRIDDVDWRSHDAPDDDPDDELLPTTPPEVVAVLGFDPLEDEDGAGD